MLMTLNRDFRLATKFGHIIIFKKDVPTSVPDLVVADAVRIGAMRVDKEPVDILEQRPEPTPEPVGPTRDEQIAAAVVQVRQTNNPDDFTAAGMPTAKAMKALLGFTPGRAEINKAYESLAAAG